MVSQHSVSVVGMLVHVLPNPQRPGIVRHAITLLKLNLYQRVTSTVTVLSNSLGKFLLNNSKAMSMLNGGIDNTTV